MATPDLTSVLEAVDAACVPDGWYAPHLFVTVSGAGLAVRTIEGHPSDVLLGYAAPADVDALGLVSLGWSGPPGEGRPSQHPERRRVRIAYVLGRDGTESSRATFDDGEVLADLGSHGPAEGFVVDCLRRALELPTPAPERPSALLFHLMWLESIVGAGRTETGSRRRLSWARAQALHPAARVLRDVGPAAGIDWGDLVAAFERATQWPAVRDSVIYSGWFAADVEGALAAWMDEGMLSRWLLGCFPPLDVLAGAARRHLTPAAARKVGAAIESSCRGGSEVPTG